MGRLIVWELLVSVSPLLKLALEAASESCGCTPVPLRAIASGEPGALLVMETLPVALPVAEGANCPLKVVLCPAASVSGTDKPVMLKPVPEVLTADMFTPAMPEFLKVYACVPL